MLQPADIQRCEWLNEQVKLLGIRFPVAELAEKTGFDQGNISSYLKCKKPISDNFLTKFKSAYGLYDDLNTQPTAMQILFTLAEAFKAQTEIIKSIESKMARENTQATIDKTTGRIEANLSDTKELIELLSSHVDSKLEDLAEQVSKLMAQKNASSRDVNKKQDETDGAGKKPGR